MGRPQQEPSVAAEQPSPSAEPDAAHAEQPSPSAEPDAATAEPDAATTEPDAATTEPDTATAEPDTATAEPGASSVAQAAASAEPATTGTEASPAPAASTPANASPAPPTTAPAGPSVGRRIGALAWRAFRGLWRASNPTVCPVCDAPLPPALATAEAPRCTACEQALVPMRVAGLWRRAVAGLVDAVVLGLTAGLLNALLLAWIAPPPLLADARGLAALLGILELDPAAVLRRAAPALVMAALYLGLFWSLTGQTLGQRALRLRVVDPWGRPPRPWRAAVRVLGHGLGLAIGAMGWLWVAFDREKRGLHDHLARTYVVRES